MINFYKAFLIVLGFFLIGCSSDESSTITTSEDTLYRLAAVSNEDVFGVVKIAKLNDTQSIIEVQLTGVSVGNHPVAIYADNAVDGTSIAISLNSLNASGYSSTTVSMLDSGVAIDYEELLEYDGHIKVKTSTTDATLLARGDIGVNTLTGESTTYVLNSSTVPTISGLVIFAKRKNEETLVVIELEGTTTGSHPAAIYNNDLATTGAVTLSLNDVDGALGEGRTNVTQLNDATPMTYDELIGYNGHLLVKLSATDASIVAEGNIGEN